MKAKLLTACFYSSPQQAKWPVIEYFIVSANDVNCTRNML